MVAIDEDVTVNFRVIAGLAPDVCNQAGFGRIDVRDVLLADLALFDAGSDAIGITR